MEITTIVGIVIAIVIMAFGLKMILKKPTDSAPSLDSELQFNEDCQQPIIPRHVRDQLQSDAKPPRVEPTLIADDVAPEAPTKSEPQALTDDIVASSNPETAKAEPSLQADTKTSALDPSATASKSEAEQDTPTPTAVTTEYSLSDEIQQVIAETAPNAETAEQNKASTEYRLNQHIETAKISDFNEESSILDSHLHEQKIMDEESALATAESFIALNIFPEQIGRAHV